MPKTYDVEGNSLKINGVVISFQNPTDGQTIIYNEFTDRWEPQNPPEYITDMKDVDIRGLITDDVLSWDGQRWVPNGHTTDKDVHYPMTAIDHKLLKNTGRYTHEQIDAHINNMEFHYQKHTIKHSDIQDHGQYTHQELDSHVDDQTIHYPQQDIDHTQLQNVGQFTHPEIDTHITSDGSDHGFIDQDVTRHASPTFRAVVLTEEPTLAETVTSKAYVDAIAQGIIWKEHVLDFWDPTEQLPSPEEGARYISLASANGWRKHFIYEWDSSITNWTPYRSEPKWAVWTEIPDALFVFNGQKWVKIGSTSDHTNLRGIGVHSHAQIDEHIDDRQIHYQVETINHNLLQNRGRYTHEMIDRHIDDQTVHFTVESIDHKRLRNIGKYSHAEIDRHIDNDNNPHKITLRQLSPTNRCGDLIVDTGQGRFQPLHAGTEGQVLSVNDKRQLCWSDLPPEEGSLTILVRLSTTGELEHLRQLDTGELQSTEPGMLRLDGVFANEGDRLLLNHQSNRSWNGVYRVVFRGASNQPFIIEKEPLQLSLGDNVYVREGAIHRESLFILYWQDRIEGCSFSKASGDANYPQASVKKIKITYVKPSATLLLPFDGRSGHNQDSFDKEALFDRENKQYVIQTNGTYLVSANLYIRSGLAQGVHKLRLFMRHGRNQKEITRAAVRNQNDVNLTFGTVILQLQAKDSIYCLYENGTKGDVIIGNTGLDFFNIVKLR